MIKYPNISVKLIGMDGNAFAILGKVVNSMKKEKLSSEEIKQFQIEALSGDYDHLLQTCMKWVNID